MATIAPTRPVEITQRMADGKSLSEALQTWRRRLWMQQTLRWTGTGSIIGVMLACLLLLISRLTPWASAPTWAIMVGIACPLCALVAALWYRPSIARTARLVDARLTLNDRLSTAWEL